MTEKTQSRPACVRTGVLTQSEFDGACPAQRAMAEQVVARAEAATSPEWFREHRWWLRDQLSFMGGIHLESWPPDDC